MTVATTELRWADRWGGCKARWGFGRMDYRVKPGLYAVGSPTPETPVFVTANYKMSFDRLRAGLAGRDGWVLVLDTDGINVWCAAGKGTFGTGELVRRIEATRLSEVVSHRMLVLPQLGAPGVSAREVRRDSGFAVRYGPVRADDLGAYLDAGNTATPEMRRVRFGLGDRMALVPLELIMSVKYLLVLSALLVVLAGLGRDGYSATRAVTAGGRAVLLLLAAYVGGAAIAPALLPWLPGRAFALKGVWVGLAMAVAAVAYHETVGGLFISRLGQMGWLLLMPAVASFMAMNFTGASTYTSLSGVKREMRLAVPMQIALAAGGLVLWLVGRFV